MRYTDFSILNDDHDWELILSIMEDFDSIKLGNPHISLKDRAIDYLDAAHDEKLNRTELRMLVAKAQKLKTSTKKEERARGLRLAKQIQQAFNIHK